MIRFSDPEPLPIPIPRWCRVSPGCVPGSGLLLAASVLGIALVDALVAWSNLDERVYTELLHGARDVRDAARHAGGLPRAPARRRFRAARCAHAGAAALACAAAHRPRLPGPRRCGGFCCGWRSSRTGPRSGQPRRCRQQQALDWLRAHPQAGEHMREVRDSTGERHLPVRAADPLRWLVPALPCSHGIGRRDRHPRPAEPALAAGAGPRAGIRGMEPQLRGPHARPHRSVRAARPAGRSRLCAGWRSWNGRHWRWPMAMPRCACAERRPGRRRTSWPRSVRPSMRWRRRCRRAPANCRRRSRSTATCSRTVRCRCWSSTARRLAILDVNEAALAHYGYAREAFLQLTIVSCARPRTWR